MSVHETKYCERCKEVFECKPGNITQCQCYGLILSDAAKQYIAGRYEDCLCPICLEEISSEFTAAKDNV